MLCYCSLVTGPGLALDTEAAEPFLSYLRPKPEGLSQGMRYCDSHPFFVCLFFFAFSFVSLHETKSVTQSRVLRFSPENKADVPTPVF